MNSTISDLEAQLVDAQTKLAADQQARAAAFNTQITAAESLLRSASERARILEDDFSRLESEVTVLSGDIREARATVDRSRIVVQERQEALDAAIAQQIDPLSVFGRNIRRLQQDIQRERWFGRVPIGPLGAFVNLPDVETWGHILRPYMGWLMMAFAVSDQRDRRKLKDMLVRSGK